MSADLEDLLLLIRQHRAFRELLTHIESPVPRQFKLSGDSNQQSTEWIFNSGRAKENEIWRQFLIGNSPEGETNPSKKENL